MTAGERTRLEADLATLVETHLADRPGIVAAYLALPGEIDPGPCVAALRANGRTIALPRVTRRDVPMTFHRHDPGDALDDGAFGLRQPSADAPECTPAIVLTPLLGFTAAGARIGYGGGHYDRAFVRLPHARRIGLGWDAQGCDALPEDEWDVRLHAIATPTRWIAA